MNSATLPTRQEINVYDSLDERSACEHFLGKTLEEAEALFRENSLYYQEDLMFMGASAFRFYVQAAINYIQSESAIGDGAIISCFASILEHRLEHEPQALAPVIPQLLCRSMGRNGRLLLRHLHQQLEVQSQQQRGGESSGYERSRQFHRS